MKVRSLLLVRNIVVALACLLGIISFAYVVKDPGLKLRDDEYFVGYSETLSSSTLDIRDSNFSLVTLEQIHIAEICYNMDSLRTLITFIKSLLFYRTNPIHMHIVTNEETAPSVRTIFSTWNIPFFTVTVYARPDVEKSASWIPFIHPAGNFAMKKLMMEQILVDVKKVIFYDADIVLTTDIYNLWKIFNNFHQDQAIGMSYETQYWYKKKDGGRFDEAWDAIEWGFNTGMILYDLQRLRQLEWADMWLDDGRKSLEKHGVAWLAEQDIFNEYFLHHPEIFYQVNCKWNMQFGSRVNLESCPDVGGYYALHTTLKKIGSTSPDEMPMLPAYWDVVENFNNMDGGRFSKNKRIHRIFPYVIDYLHTPGEGNAEVALILWIKAKEIKKFKRMIDDWPGPMSVAVSGSDAEFSLTAELPARGNIGCHYVFKNEGEEEIDDDLLKTIAIKHLPSKITHIVISDVRFQMRENTYEIFKQSINENPYLHVAIPTFVSKCFVFGRMFGKEHMWKQVVYKKFAIEPEANEELYLRWLLEDEPYKTIWNTQYDKFIVMPKKSHPLYTLDNTDIPYEDILYSNLWLTKIEVKILPCCLALKVPFAGEAVMKPGFNVNCELVG